MVDPNQSMVSEEEEEDFVPSTQAPPVADSAKKTLNCFEFSEGNNVMPSSPASCGSIFSETESKSMSTDDQKSEMLVTLCSSVMKLPDSIGSVSDFNKLDILLLKTQADMLIKLEEHRDSKKRVKVDLLESQPTPSSLNIGEEASMGSENTEQQNADMN